MTKPLDDGEKIESNLALTSFALLDQLLPSEFITAFCPRSVLCFCYLASRYIGPLLHVQITVLTQDAQ